MVDYVSPPLAKITRFVSSKMPQQRLCTKVISKKHSRDLSTDHFKMAKVESICYDIKDDRRRVQVAKALADFGERVQFSVFEANLGPEELAQLIRRVSRVLHPEEDNLRMGVALLRRPCSKVCYSS